MNVARASIDLTAPRLNQIFKLADRKIGFAEYGRQDGRPVFYLHGTPSSRLEIGMWDALCNRLNVRMICPDRPGIGLSTLVPQRTIAEYPSDVASLARYLGWSKFSVIGGSGGAPYAMACARFLPSDNLDTVGIIAGSGPPEAGSKGMPWLGRGAAYFFSHFPSLMAWALNHSLVQAAQDPDPAVFADQILKTTLHLRNEADKAAINQDAEWIVAASREVYKNDAAGAAWELYLMTRPWRFQLEDIKHQIKLWCGTDDTNTPLAMSRYMAAKLPDARLVELPNQSHYTIFAAGVMEGILEELDC